ncbi:GNAT family N-acetyltransferase [Kinneretia aquatilis]|uniref:GNAT family N-acetyltransferase n=1 Tax=Kinneretia aquatilis TaxID=2070761 RepID=UPI00149527CA|nr:GNAT family protein [Paucibacter aquatile]WIV99010.1 GNAT family protein [Paucibacter aquatile]
MSTDDLSWRQLEDVDAAQLLAFELQHRAFFEARINARAPSYYRLEAVRASLDEARAQRLADQAYGFVLQLGGEIVGRINLTAVQRQHFNRAQLGYRIGEPWQGRGIASRAVAQLLQRARAELGLWRIEAVARAGNLGSVRVLERNGFTPYGRTAQSMCIQGEWHDQILFEWRSGEAPHLQPAPV